uniref:Probable non-specific lipid-transfer protein 2 n=1 Tax=Parietaria judaica TaxID=33127 RepID=NLT22_PARJU|nr:RecName: Full=Probable non-specific lipid-transfer protein 2; Short=LTP 2; AltName: Full=Allergen Par j II; AltName: Full=Major pollen allergen Par j 2.0102; AltName: Full=Protein P8; AltName: Allergen=Par j 2.0102; Flags: Precursor [Parietaria judaica]CAA65122.1 P8 protein [Parietaria judaica]
MRTVSMAALVVIAAALAWTSSAELASAPAPGEGPCGKVVHHIMPCLKFVKGEEKEPSKSCCSGTKKLSEEVKTTEQKREACKCIVAATKGISGIKNELVAEVPKKCGITTTLPPITADFDCSKIESTIFRGYY